MNRGAVFAVIDHLFRNDICTLGQNLPSKGYCLSNQSRMKFFLLNIKTENPDLDMWTLWSLDGTAISQTNRKKESFGGRYVIGAELERVYVYRCISNDRHVFPRTFVPKEK